MKNTIIINFIFLIFTVSALCNCVKVGKQDKPIIRKETFTGDPNWYCLQIDEPKQAGNVSQRAVGGKGKFWPTGSVLKVGFIGGNSTVIDAVKRFAPEWTKHANIKFEFPTNGPYDIRVSFSTGGGAWSYVGIDAKNIAQTSPTMNLGWIDQDVILHEFGHAIGLFHEHQNPQGGICFNEANVIKDLSGPPNNWNEQIIRHNVLSKFRATDVITSAWDRNSIMHYAIPASWTCNNVSIAGGKVISLGDAAFIKSVYPGSQPPPTTTINLSTSDVDMILSLMNSRQSEIDTTAARFRRSNDRIKTILKR